MFLLTTQELYELTGSYFVGEKIAKAQLKKVANILEAESGPLSCLEEDGTWSRLPMTIPYGVWDGLKREAAC